MGEDWPYELFVEKADLYLWQLEERLQRGEEEAELLVKLFQAHGVTSHERILDLCCGIGRHSLALAKRGFSVVGVDFSPKFLQRARELAEAAGVGDRVEFVLQDIRKIDKLSYRDFAVALCLFTSFGYYGEEQDHKFLRSVRKLVRPGGIFVLDVFSRERLIRNFQPGHAVISSNYILIEETSFNLEESRTCSRWLFFQRSFSARTSKRETNEEQEGWVYAGEAKVSVRAYCLHELIRMLREAGWEYQAAYGGLDMSPYTLESRRLVVVAKNPG